MPQSWADTLAARKAAAYARAVTDHPAAAGRSTPVGSTPVGSTPVGSTPAGSTPVPADHVHPETVAALDELRASLASVTAALDALNPSAAPSGPEAAGTVQTPSEGSPGPETTAEAG